MSLPGSLARIDAPALSSALDDDPIVTEVVRGDLLECVHRGRVVVTAPDGSVVFGLGSVEASMFPRSSIKPVQAIAMLRAGLDLSGAALALAAASHSGETFHRDLVVEVLTGAGLGVDDLQTTPDFPLDEAARVAWIREGHDKEPLAMNCSGKHAAMLRTCVRAGWPTETYRDPSHPLQQAIAAAVEEFAGEATHTSVDGCGAPLFAMSLTGLARAFGRIAGASDGPERAVADAYRQFPEYASGSSREDLSLHRAVPGLICKGGAEGCLAIGLPDGTGVAIKSDDGNMRGVFALAAVVLTALGHGSSALDELALTPVLGHGEPVGVVQVRRGVLDGLAQA
ncbi:asparaginase [Aestuariimicrobium soli]|uniref:asparaginase n=1 Tax=Aestuariimicrobium soli TaxID=2035834 RepID=UPI003EBFD01A